MITVVVTTLNEEDAVTRLMQALVNQTLRPDAVIVADGGSTDGTVQRIRDISSSMPFDIQVLLAPGNVPAGRNAAIARADSTSIIAVTDADCVPDANWLELLTEPIRSGSADACAGAYYAESNEPLVRAIGVFTWVPLRKNSRRFLPSHRSVAYRKSVWTSLAGYNEKYDAGEDTAFDIEVERRFSWAAAPQARVKWHPRTTVRAALRQQIFYGTGDGQAKIQAIYHTGIALFVVAQFGAVFGTGVVRVGSLCALACAYIYFLAKDWQLFRSPLKDAGSIALLLCILPPARLLGFFIGLLGFSGKALFRRA